VLERKCRFTKFEFVGDDIYHVIALYLEVEDMPYSLEMVSKITDETLLGAHGRREIVESISNHNKKLYYDPVTGVYNRRYYEDQLKWLTDIDAVALLDVDDFKRINDSHGHQVGDEALRLITETILSCIRSTDAVVRFGGDEFIIVFRSMPEHILQKKMDLIQSRIAGLRMETCPDLRFSISIGGVYGGGRIEEMLQKADALMYQAKNERRDSAHVNG
jgi:putative two-component system response regulator